MTTASDNTIRFEVDADLSVYVLPGIDRDTVKYGIGTTPETATVYTEAQSESLRRSLEQAREYVEEFRHDLLNKELPRPHSKPSEYPVFSVYQLKDQSQPSNHLSDYNLVAMISTPTVEQAQAHVRCQDWHTRSECTLLIDNSNGPIRPCTFGDVIGIPAEDRSVGYARMYDTPQGTRLYPVKLDETPRHQPGDIGHQPEPSISQAESNAQRPQPVPPGDKSTRRKP